MEKLLITPRTFVQVPNRVLRYKYFVLSGLIVISLLGGVGDLTRTELDMTTTVFWIRKIPRCWRLMNIVANSSDDSVFLWPKTGMYSRENLCWLFSS